MKVGVQTRIGKVVATVAHADKTTAFKLIKQSVR